MKEYVHLFLYYDGLPLFVREKIRSVFYVFSLREILFPKE